MIEFGIPIIDAIVNTFLNNVSEISLYAISIAIYAIVIWHYYRLLARRDFFILKKQTEKALDPGLKIFLAKLHLFSNTYYFFH
jgi:hypothetical protein